MERERVGGRFVGKNRDGDGGVQKTRASTLKPARCRTYTRARLAEALPEIVAKFVEEAKRGSIAHAKLLTSLGGLDKGTIPEPKKRRTKGIVGLLMDRLERDRQGREEGEGHEGTPKGFVESSRSPMD